MPQEEAHAPMARHHVVDELHDEDRLAHAGTAEQPHLAAPLEGGEEVDGLDPGLQDLGARAELGQRDGRAMNGPAIGEVQRTELVDGLTEHVDGPTEQLLADADLERAAGVHDGRSAPEPPWRRERDSAHDLVAALAQHLDGDRRIRPGTQQVVELGESVGEARVDHAPTNGDDPSLIGRMRT
jgi:hypothetical protein